MEAGANSIARFWSRLLRRFGHLRDGFQRARLINSAFFGQNRRLRDVAVTYGKRAVTVYVPQTGNQEEAWRKNKQ